MGFGVAIFKGSIMVAKARLKLNTRCSNNQAEQFAILKALETIESINNNKINPRTVIIYTDSPVSLDSLSNTKNQAFLVEKIRKKLANLENNERKIKFSWVKAHAGNYGNETAGRLAKEAARRHRTNYEYNRIPISAITYDAAEEAVRKWQTEWTTSLKAAAKRLYIPSVRERLGMRIHLTTKLTAVLWGNGKTRAYLLRFNLREEATCICGKEDQTMDHLLFNCIKTKEQRNLLKRRINKTMNLQDNKQELITKYRKVYSEFIESRDFDQLQQGD